MENLSRQLDLREAAIEQAVVLLEEKSVEIDSESPLAKLLFSEEGDDDFGEEEEEEE